MADTKKIDSYFSNGIPLEPTEGGENNKRKAKVRLAKLILPTIAAAIFGIMMTFPYLKNTQTNLDFDVTLPKKGELEKLHVENTIFNITDKDNKVSNFTADHIDETEPQSKIIKLVNPKGKLPLKNGDFAKINSTSGFYDQANNRISMLDEVFINYNDETEIKTSRATYDFNQHLAKGNAPIEADGVHGKMKAKSFEFDTKNEIYKLFGNSFLHIKRQPNDVVIKARDSIILYKQQQKVVISGNGSINDGDNTLFAEKIDVFYTQKDKKQELKDMQAFGSLKLVSPKGTVYADRGKYNPVTGFLELFDNVVIEQGDNKIYGDYATHDLKTGVSKIVSSHSGSRVRGVFKKSKKIAAERKK